MTIQIYIVPTLAAINRFCLDNFESDSVIKKAEFNLQMQQNSD